MSSKYCKRSFQVTVKRDPIYSQKFNVLHRRLLAILPMSTLHTYICAVWWHGVRWCLKAVHCQKLSVFQSKKSNVMKSTMVDGVKLWKWSTIVNYRWPPIVLLFKPKWNMRINVMINLYGIYNNYSLFKIISQSLLRILSLKNSSSTPTTYSHQDNSISNHNCWFVVYPY